MSIRACEYMSLKKNMFGFPIFELKLHSRNVLLSAINILLIISYKSPNRSEIIVNL